MTTEFYVYLHSRPDGSPFYVGKGSKKRSRDFKKNRNKYHGHVVAKYGADRIGVCIFPCDSEKQAFDLEVTIIDVLRKAGFNLTNLTDGGDGVVGCAYTPERLLKMSLSHLGKKLPAAQRAKMSAARMGRVVSAQTRAKISVSHLGKKHTAESRAKMSASASKRTRTRK